VDPAGPSVVSPAADPAAAPAVDTPNVVAPQSDEVASSFSLPMTGSSLALVAMATALAIGGFFVLVIRRRQEVAA
jgi:LPXTG-motif cell wall-anchored protein